MDYLKHYELIISRAKNRTLEGYTEKHHIVPKCMGGTDDKENIAILTAREHYVAHQLLAMAYPEIPGLTLAVHLMSSPTKHQIRNNKSYQWVRVKAAEASSKMLKGKPRPKFSQDWCNNISKGLVGRNLSDEHKSSISKTLTGVKKSDQMRANMSIVAKNRTPEHRSNLSKSLTGRKISEETKEKMRAVSLRQKDITCPHCGKTGKPRGMKCWHFDKCKEKPNGL